MFRLLLTGVFIYLLLLPGAGTARTGSVSPDIGDSAYILYLVNDGSIDEAESYLPQQIDRLRAERIWQVFAAIIPAQQLSRVQEYYVNGPENAGGASVIPVDDGLREWQLSIDEKSVELKDQQDMQDLAFLLVHEFGHILTLNHEQVEADYTVCKNRVELEEGCARQDSYINVFVQRFWTPQMLNEAKAESAEAVYGRYRDYFLDEYAATNPVEDIAESFSIFVEEEQPQDCQVSIAEQKLCFFYDFSELVILRSQIRAGVAEL